MKTKLLFFVVLISLLGSCKKTNVSDPTPTPTPAPTPTPVTCNNVSSFSAVQQDDAVKFTLNTTGTSLYYQTYWTNSGATTGPTTGIPANGLSYLPDLAISSAGTYFFYVRSVCSAGAGPWIGPVTVNISSFCKRPYSINYSDLFSQGLTWSADYSPAQSQVQYGVQGFALGSGTIKTVPGLSFTEAVMNANTTYDFYVRLSCGSGWSSWVGPYSFLSVGPHHLCTPPSNVTYNIEYSGGVPFGASFSWYFNGENSSECTVVLSGGNPNTGTIRTQSASSATIPVFVVARNTNYDFYVRNVCIDGSRTAWIGPKLFNIH